MSFIWTLIFSMVALGAGERFYKGRLLPPVKESQSSRIPSISVKSPLYPLDINSDGVLEFFRTEKKNNLDYIVIQNSEGTEIFRHKLQAYGGGSYVHKVKLVKLSPDQNALVLFFYEGFINAYQQQGQGRLYFLSFDKNTLKNFHLFKAPHNFVELETPHNQYLNRKYQLEVRDLDQDQNNELIVYYGHIQRIHSYQGNGFWKVY